MAHVIPSSRDTRRWRALFIVSMLAIGLLIPAANARPLTPGWTGWVKDALDLDRLASLHGMPHLYPIHLLPTESRTALEKDGSQWLTQFAMGNHAWLSPQMRLNSAQSPWLLPAISGSISAGDARIRLHGAFELSQRDATDLSTTNLNPWREDVVLRVPHAGIWIEPLPRFSAFVGRTAIQWGPGYRSNLGVSDNSPPFDLVLLHYQPPLEGRFRIYSSLFATRLDPVWHEQPRYLAQRYYMGHRLDAWLGNRLGIGISEFVLYGGEAPYWESMYFNPVMPYYVSQYNADRDDNVIVTGDFWCRLFSGVAAYGELLVDDYQYAQSDSPDALAMMAGLHWSDEHQNELRTEYARMNRWVYTHRIPEQRYTHYGTAIGQPLGPDSDQWWTRWQHWLSPDTQLSLSYVLQRKGEATPSDRFLGGEHWLIPFPSGVVTWTHTAQFKYDHEPWHKWQYGVEYRFRATRNAEHEMGNHTHEHEWRSYLKYRIGT